MFIAKSSQSDHKLDFLVRTCISVSLKGQVHKVYFISALVFFQCSNQLIMVHLGMLDNFNIIFILSTRECSLFMPEPRCPTKKSLDSPKGRGGWRGDNVLIENFIICFF